MLNKTVTVELRSIVTVFCLLGQSPILHCGVFRDPKNETVLVVEVASAYSIIIMIGSPTALFNRGGIHMNSNSLSHTKWNCKYHIVFAPKLREVYSN